MSVRLTAGSTQYFSRSTDLLPQNADYPVLQLEAGVPDSTLVRIVAEERAATPAVAAAVAGALDEWGARCGQLSKDVRQAQRGGRNE